MNQTFQNFQTKYLVNNVPLKTNSTQKYFSTYCIESKLFLLNIIAYIKTQYLPLKFTF
jgi:hypothetical protein